MSSQTIPPKSLIKSILENSSTKHPHFTPKMQNSYDYSLYDEDPDILFEDSATYLNEIQGLSSSNIQCPIIEKFLEMGLCEVVYGSNMIEEVGLGYDTTVRLCSEVFHGRDPEQIQLLVSEQEEAIRALDNATKATQQNYLVQKRKEVVQHALAFKYIIDQMLLKKEHLSEHIIKETHRMLTEDLDSSDGCNSKEYSGQYRTVDVVAGFTAFTPPSAVPNMVSSLVHEFTHDITKAGKEQVLDPWALSAKYCHKFVNIHPFLDGNGRMCRLILNAVLLKYAGVVVPIGGEESDRQEYLEIAIKGSMAEQVEEDMRGRDPWAELTSFVLKKGAGKIEILRNTLGWKKS